MLQYFFCDRRPWLVWAILIVLVSLDVSCERRNWKQVYPVEGQVLLDGKPAADATVFFYLADSADSNPSLKVESDGIAPYAVTDKEGKFKLTTYLTFDGAPAGDYIVTVRCPAPARRGDEEQGPDLLRGRYNDIKTSPLRAKVEKKANTFTFEVFTKKK